MQTFWKKEHLQEKWLEYQAFEKIHWKYFIGIKVCSVRKLENTNRWTARSVKWWEKRRMERIKRIKIRRCKRSRGYSIHLWIRSSYGWREKIPRFYVRVTQWWNCITGAVHRLRLGITKKKMWIIFDKQNIFYHP